MVLKSCEIRIRLARSRNSKHPKSCPKSPLVEAVQKVIVAFSKPKLIKSISFILSDRVKFPLRSGDRTQCNKVQGDGRNEQAPRKFGQ